MTKQALIAYGTRYGSTAEVAERIGEALSEKGLTVTVLNTKEESAPTNLIDFDLVIVGSGILAGRWTKEPIEFLKENKSVLADKDVALFVVCAYAANPKTRDDAFQNYLVDVGRDLDSITPISLGFFGGVIDFSKYNFAVRALMKRMVKSTTGDEEVSEFMDLRDWEKIESWAKSLVTE